jgi:hypothetical protein
VIDRIIDEFSLLDAFQFLIKVTIRAIKGYRLYMEDEDFVSEGGRFAAVFDGHGGNGVSRYLHENLYKHICYYLYEESEEYYYSATSIKVPMEALGHKGIDYWTKDKVQHLKNTNVHHMVFPMDSLRNPSSSVHQMGSLRYHFYHEKAFHPHSYHRNDLLLEFQSLPSC